MIRGWAVDEGVEWTTSQRGWPAAVLPFERWAGTNGSRAWAAGVGVVGQPGWPAAGEKALLP